MKKKLVGVFHSVTEVVEVIGELKKHGYRSDEISIIAKDEREMKDVERQTDMEYENQLESGITAGLTTGGILGGLTGLLVGLGALVIPGVGPIIAAGPIAATLGGAVLGASAGGLTGALISAGVPEEYVTQYDRYLSEGNIIVLVDAHVERSQHVYDTFKRNSMLNEHLYYDPKTQTEGIVSTSKIPNSMDRR